ncbi:MAG TPA: Fur family transcriptional regulator [Candidatus Paceibacterota bacterium]|nr:Fur family transcriptional regulator [Candidatus Paceibacterota bacterium]
MHTPDFKGILREGGYKATPGRVLLLSTLFGEAKPVTVSYLEKKLKSALDKVTLYRALESMVASGVVREVDFRHGHAHYELQVYRQHHHHIVCTNCGLVEDTNCNTEAFVKQVAKKSKKFDTVVDHSMEFFGICKTCAANA